MEAFLDRVAREILAESPQLHRSGIILPSRRAQRAIRQAFQNQLKNPALSPAIWPVETVMQELAQREPARPMDQLMVLFAAHEEVFQSRSQPLEEFLRWAPTVLRDFGEMDRHGVNASEVYTEMREIEALSLWGLDEPTELMTRRLDLWKQLPALYTRYHERLEAKGWSTPGGVFQKASPAPDGPSESALHAWMQKSEIDRLYFVGFNALTPSEKALLISAHRHVGARAFWDADAHYVLAEAHEAGWAMRENLKGLPDGLTEDLRHPPAWYATSQTTFTVLRANRSVGVTKAMGTVLEELTRSNPTLHRTAVVLADEALLIPTLQALPTQLEEANVTMGMPLTSTAAFAGLDAFFQLHEARELSGGTYPYRLLQASCIHPVCQALYEGAHALPKAAEELRRGKRAHWTVDQACELLGEGAHLWQAYTDARPFLADLSVALRCYVDDLRSAWEAEPARLCLNALESLRTWMPDQALSFGSLRRLFKQFAQESPVNFYGEPFQGLQVLGLLETRNLDFDTLILAPVNEGILPKGRNDASFLPFDVRRAYGMPLPQEREAIMAYHFYRLCQRAKRVFFLVNGESDGMGKGEPSRFLAQMAIELQRYPGIRWEDRSVQLALDSSRLTQPWKIEKTPQVLQRLLFQLGDRGLSPSTLSTYLNDPAEFYVRFVLGIREEEAVEERMAANIRGKVLHDVHEMLFKHFQKEQVWALDRVYDAVEAGIQKHFPGPRKTGPFVIERNVLHKMALDWATAEGNRIVNDEDRDSPWHIHLVEEKLETFLVINDEHVKVQGRADRIEAWNNGWAVVDLKSGGFQKSELSVSTLEDLRKPSKGKALQLFTYAWLLSKYQAGGPFRAGIHAMRKPQDAVAWLSFQRSEWIERETLDAFEHDVLGPIIAEMLDTSIPFRAADFEEEEG
ncbi:MAG TPA: hypothetical protein DCE58_04430 [Cryomorphaceae bacterium]|nr:hypothetical protein [Cryomorphaceae bacterium]